MQLTVVNRPCLNSGADRTESSCARVPQPFLPAFQPTLSLTDSNHDSVSVCFQAIEFHTQVIYTLIKRAICVSVPSRRALIRLKENLLIRYTLRVFCDNYTGGREEVSEIWGRFHKAWWVFLASLEEGGGAFGEDACGHGLDLDLDFVA